MGTTLWVLSKNNMASGDDYDHSAMMAVSEMLDPICESIGVKKLSSFFDWTDFNANMSENEEFPDEETIKETASWFAPADALPTLEHLRNYLASNDPVRKGLFEADLQHFAEYLLDELDDCIAKVKIIKSENDVFHLCVVM